MRVLPEKTVGTWQPAGIALAAVLTAMFVSDFGRAAEREPARADECPARGTQPVSFARVMDGAGFVTAEGVEIRLAGILARDGGGEVASPEAQAAARDALERALRNRTVSIASATPAGDRYGRQVAQVFADGSWVQGALLQAGDVRAAPDLASAPCARALLAAEAQARTSRTGNWRGTFRVRTPDELMNSRGSFEIVEGTVTTASVNRGRAFINFGADYRTDFTVTAEPEDMRIFRQTRFDVSALAGKRIRVRGWVEFYNGPEITITTPAAIEVLE